MLEGKVVVVTGAGSGLGRALCQAFHAQGSIVVGVGRTAGSLEETGQSLGHERYSWETADVANPAQVEHAVANIIERHSRIDYLFNNAAVYHKVGFLEETPEQWAQTIAINVNGPANCCKAVLPHMLKNGFGRIFNVGSFADYAPIPESAAYSVSKGALHALSKGIVADLATHDADIEIHEWTPGHLNTQMSDFTGIDPAISAGWAVGLAQRPPSERKALLFENDHEVLPPKGLKQRILDKLLFRK